MSVNCGIGSQAGWSAIAPPGAFIFDDQADDFGRSNLFTDLVWYLLTNKTPAPVIRIHAMLEEESFELTSKFLVQTGSSTTVT